jgi:tetratricopeptide (TPR) repeat protein
MARSPDFRRLDTPINRAITNEYHLELTAENTADIKRELIAQRQLQAQAAALNLRGQVEIARRQDTTNEFLDSILSSLDYGFDRLSDQLEMVDDTLKSGFKTIDNSLQSGFGSVVAVLNQSVVLMTEQLKTQKQITETLSKPYDTNAQELLREGQKWLTQGERSEGRERLENWNDALRLFQKVTENEIGQQNYVAWFNIGYLRWKHLKNLTEAENAFFRSQRLSAPSRDIWHTKSLRHLAEMQYLQGKQKETEGDSEQAMKMYEEAYATAHKALAVRREYSTLFNAARYAAKTGRKEEAASLLDECIELDPWTIHSMYGEEDFSD